jgi:hypothetical protein
MTLPSSSPSRASNTTQSLRSAAENYEAKLKRDRWLELYRIDLGEWATPPRGAWEVSLLGEAEMLAGAQLGDLAVLCDVADPNQEPNASVKTKDNFRGVYSSRSEPKVRCYYFRRVD